MFPEDLVVGGMYQGLEEEKSAPSHKKQQSHADHALFGWNGGLLQVVSLKLNAGITEHFAEACVWLGLDWRDATPS
ncbi:hypothetical protein DSL72_004532 [Monilinia vaccinii-corymbosi]|uniref:Uncharacterized protein n=1 Tax=Monilinia vaccinii-corymbosi TaxID=61207 RepID=A0A8A3P2F9_9HELO|nr:hypothetical protein DSL72_004532 [Monilinia vaccinii-corymbosi]